MKFTDENGNNWESTTSEYGNGTHWIQRIPPREKSNAEIARAIDTSGNYNRSKEFLGFMVAILDAVDAKIAPLVKRLEALENGQAIRRKIEKLEGAK